MSENRSAPLITCRGCTTTWTGVRRAHCSACHRTFNGAEMFDRHRTGGRCVDPLSWSDGTRLVDGIWTGPTIDRSRFAS